MKSKSNIRWVVKVVLISVFASMAFTLASTEVMGRAGNIIAFSVLAAFIIIGLIFDVVGVAVTVAAEAPFHSMATRRERGAQEAIRLIKSADRVASFCNDVIGDVTGIVSGAMAGMIAARLVEGFVAGDIWLPLLISGGVTGLTVGGKAIGKNFAITNSTKIVLKVGKCINFLRIKPKSK